MAGGGVPLEAEACLEELPAVVAVESVVLAEVPEIPRKGAAGWVFVGASAKAPVAAMSERTNVVVIEEPRTIHSLSRQGLLLGYLIQVEMLFLF